jgi:hypothetical protein
MSDQRSYTVTRLRSRPDLFDCTTKQFSSQQERRQFRQRIGHRATRKDAHKFYYDSTNVPILHKDYADKYDYTKFFLNELLFIVRLLTSFQLLSVPDSRNSRRYTPPLLVDPPPQRP